MPELPEVEQFRKILLPLCFKTSHDYLQLSLVSSDNPPKAWLSPDDIQLLQQEKVICVDVIRKGKQICMVLQPSSNNTQSQTKTSSSINSFLSPAHDNDGQIKNRHAKTHNATMIPSNQDADYFYLFLHMGMTGCIKSPGVFTAWGHEGSLREEGNGDNTIIDNQTESVKETDSECFPPKYAYLTFQAGNYRAAFCDPRKFGKCFLSRNLSIFFYELAPDALELSLYYENQLINNKPSEERATVSSKVRHDNGGHGLRENTDNEEYQYALHRITNQSIGIKSLLLDQRRAVSGVGNWVADEVLYQTQIHPDQDNLSMHQAHGLLVKLKEILRVAVQCLEQGKAYPVSWIFHYRWNKNRKKTGSKKKNPKTVKNKTTKAIMAEGQSQNKKSAETDISDTDKSGNGDFDSNDESQIGKDYYGKTITFIKSAGRTSAIIFPAQRLRKAHKPTPPQPQRTETSPQRERRQQATSPGKRKRSASSLMTTTQESSNDGKKAKRRKINKNKSDSNNSVDSSISNSNGHQLSKSDIPIRRSPRFVTP